MDRVRALVVPARGCRDAQAAHRGADQPRAGPSRPARLVRGVRRGEAQGVRASGRRRCRRPPEGVRCECPARRLASSSRETTRFRRSRCIPGAHNRENAAAATAAARAAGIDDAAIAKALATFPGVEHRIEEIAVVDGVRYVNDSKATNAAAALRALASFPGVRKHVILGGRGKAEPYDTLAAAFEAGDRAYLIGESADELAEALSAAGVRFERSETLAVAVRCGHREGDCRRRCAPVARLCLVRPVRELRAPWGGVPPPGAEAHQVSRTQLEQRLLVLVTLALVAFGLVMVFSATSAKAAIGEGDPMQFLVKQSIYAAGGLVLLAALSRVDYHHLRPLAPIALVGALGGMRRRARRSGRRSTARIAGSSSARRASSRPSSQSSPSASGSARTSRGDRRRRRWPS